MNKTKAPRIGKLPPRYIFILNPYSDARFTRCPGCDQKTKQRKLPLFIHVDPMHPIVLGKTCRYCPDCDLLIVHQDELEAQLAALFEERAPDVIGNDYLVLGTVERKAWREGMKQPKGIPEMVEHIHDFREVRTVEYQPAGWYPADDSASRGKPAKEKSRPLSIGAKGTDARQSAAATPIDDYAKAMKLVRKMEAHLPIPARPTRAFIRAMKAQGTKIARDQELSIRRVFYMGDEGGISCDVTPPGMEKTPIICSITHIGVKAGHPLTEQIRAYQRERKRRLAQTGAPREPTSFTVEPRKKRRRR